MKSLFAKLFLWFWVAMLAIGGTLLLVQHHWPLGHGLPGQEVMAGHAEELSRIHDEDGLPGVAAYMRTLNRGETVRYWLVNPRGRAFPFRRGSPDMREELLALATDPDRAGPRERVLPVMLGEVGHVLIAQAPRRGFADLPWWGRLLVALLVTAAFSALLARKLSRPVRRVRDASRRLAAGELDTRVLHAGPGGDDIDALGHDFNLMADRLQSLLQARNELLRDISHELRSPLARLQVALELGRGQLEPASLDRIEREIERMDALIGELLALARLEAGTTPLRRDPVELASLLRDVCDDADFEARAKSRSVRLEVTDGCRLSGDPGLLQSVFDNVVRNAVRHTRENSVVDVTLACDDDEAVVTVTDAGPGVPEEALVRIFEPFTRVSAARERESGGHGIGLAIARRAVMLHGGTIVAANAPSGGLQVTIRIPLS